ncbi:MAG TPA: hypothetical protein PLX17_02260 [Chitinophagaceae bacterium]|nr:hypothetical protein [Chitinophagaceae bacterium]
MTEELPVNVINLMHREERKSQAEQQAKEQGFYIKFWEGIIDRHDRKRGVHLAHRQIVQDAKDNGYKMVCIAEDDILFFKSPDGKLAWDYFLEKMPDEFHTYHAMIYAGTILNNRITSLFSSLTLYIVHESFYDFYLSLPESIHLDRHLGLTANIHKYMICDKFVCYQDGSKSDNNFMTCDYSSHLIGRPIYGKD